MNEPFDILLIDDEPWSLVHLKKLFDRPELGCRVVGALRSSYDALEQLTEMKPHVVVTDIRMPDLTGLELIQYIRSKGIDCEVVIVSGFAEFSYAQEAVRYGAFEYCLKPLTRGKAEELIERLGKCLGEKRAAAPESDLCAESDHNFDKLLRYIEEHYDQRLYLKDLAGRFFLNPNYCCSLFLKNMGTTFSQYITDLRMRKAVELLSGSHMSVGRIATIVGYSDSLYFSKVFKKQYGSTPNQYRKQGPGVS